MIFHITAIGVFEGAYVQQIMQSVQTIRTFHTQFMARVRVASLDKRFYKHGQELLTPPFVNNAYDVKEENARPPPVKTMIMFVLNKLCLYFSILFSLVCIRNTFFVTNLLGHMGLT